MTSFVLNGTQHTITPEPGLTVLDYLRLEARLTATKEGCAEGDCGACTIVIGERQGEGLAFSAVNACIMRAADLDGRVVLTAEGLAGEDAPHPAQQAIVAFHASQCGFCTPGFVMSFYALTQSPAPETPAARRALILDALAGNLCRCTGYRPLIDAAEALPHAADPRISAWRAALDALPPPTGPATLDELASRLARQPAARLTAGTTDIGVGIAKYGNIPADMLSVRHIPELRNVGWEGDELVIGAAATYSQILPFLDQALPNFAALIRRLGSVQIRNIGTMGGNICNASPIGDSAPCLIALGATLVLRSASAPCRSRIFSPAIVKQHAHPANSCAPSGSPALPAARHSLPTSSQNASIRTSRPSPPPSSCTSPAIPSSMPAPVLAGSPPPRCAAMASRPRSPASPSRPAPSRAPPPKWRHTSHRSRMSARPPPTASPPPPACCTASARTRCRPARSPTYSRYERNIFSRPQARPA